MLQRHDVGWQLNVYNQHYSSGNLRPSKVIFVCNKSDRKPIKRYWLIKQWMFMTTRRLAPPPLLTNWWRSSYEEFYDTPQRNMYMVRVLFVSFCYGLASAKLTHLLTGTRTIILYPSANEITLKNMGKYIKWVQQKMMDNNKIKQHKTVYLGYSYTVYGTHDSFYYLWSK